MGGRSALEQEVIGALVESQAVNFDAVGGVLSKYGAQLARNGDAFYFVVHGRVFDICIPPEQFVGRVREVELQGAARQVAGEVRG